MVPESTTGPSSALATSSPRVSSSTSGPSPIGVPSFTPIRVRGKRSATKDEKWNHAKQRKQGEPASDSESSQRSRRKRKEPQLSGLECLPTEILHEIFELSENLELPDASPRIASQLQSRHLYIQVTSRLLKPLVSGPKNSWESLKDILRLSNCTFFTWPFFREWLLEEWHTPRVTLDWGDVDKCDSPNPSDDDLKRWWLLRLASNNKILLPPVKLYRGPFTYDNIQLFAIMMSHSPDHYHWMDPVYRELAMEGRKEAIQEGSVNALALFCRLVADTDIDLLRFAVINAGCNKDVVSWLVEGPWHKRVDFLDGCIWQWAQRARWRGDEKGFWLIDLLKRRVREEYRRGAMEVFEQRYPGLANVETSQEGYSMTVSRIGW